MRIHLAVVLLLASCDPGGAVPGYEVDASLEPDAADVADAAPADARAPDSGPAPIVPPNSLWDAQVLGGGCTGTNPLPLPKRVQFSTGGLAFIVFANSYSDQTEWSATSATTLQTGSMAMGSTGATLCPMTWTLTSETTLTGTVTYAAGDCGAPTCTADLLLVME